MDIKEIKTLLETEVKSLDFLISLSNINFRMAPAVKIESSTNTGDYYPLYSVDRIKEGINKYLDGLDFLQYRESPVSEVFFAVAGDEYLPGYNLSDYYAVIRKLYLANGKVLNVSDTVRYDRYEKIHIANSNTQIVIDSLQADIFFYYPADMKRIELSPDNNEYRQGNSIIRLTEMDNSSGSFIVTGNFVGNIVSVLATSVNGKVLKSSSSNQNTLGNVKAFEMAGNIRPLLADIISRIDQGLLKTPDEVKKELLEIAGKYPEEVMAPQKLVKAYYGFNTDIKNLCLTIYSSRDSITRSVTIPNRNMDNWEVVIGENGKSGLMDKVGNWFIKPQYEYLEYVKGLFYKVGIDNDDKKKYFRLDKEKKQLIPEDFNYIHKSFNDGSIFIVSGENYNRGVINDKGKYIVPMKYKHIDYYKEEGMFSTYRETKDSCFGGLYSMDGTQVLPEKYQVKDINDGFIYGLLCDTSPIQSFVLNKEKKQILKDNWYYETYLFSEGYLLVGGEGLYKRFYIDTLGNVVIPYDENKLYVSPIINGLAEFRDNDVKKYGYIDNKGNEVIPPLYSYAEPFYSDVAYVEKEGKAFFIDKNYRVVKELASSIRNRYKINIGKPIEKVRLELENGEVYDAYGNLIAGEK